MTTPVAVVTGAGSGIGRALARQLDSENYDLVISDVNEVGLAETVSQLKRKPKSLRMDVSKREEVHALADEVIKQFGRVDLVINNAGVALDGTVLEETYEDLEWIFGINFWGMVYGTKAYLPQMLKQNSGTIVNVSSVFGILGIPRQSAYCATKFAIRGFTESLWAELDGTGVNAVSVHPGGIKTNIAKAARSYNDAATAQRNAKNFEKMFRTSPEDAAATILRGVYEKKKRVLIGSDAHAIHVLSRVMPDAYSSIVAKMAKRYD